MNDDKIGYALQQRLQSAQDYDQVEVSLFLPGEHAQAALEDVASVGTTDGAAARVETIKNRARQEQQELLAFLNDQKRSVGFADADLSVPRFQGVESIWVNNSVRVTLTRSGLDDVLRRKDVMYAELVRHVDVAELLDAKVRKSTPKRRGRARKAEAPRVEAPHVNAVDAPGAPTWSVQRVNAPKLWQVGLNGTGVLAAIIDTGVNYNHPDLKNCMWDGGADFPNHGYDFDSNDNDPIDQAGHGTCCAGIVAGDGTAGKGTGVAPGTRIMALRVGGAESNFWKAFQFAIDHKVHVISMSMSWKYPSHPNYPGWRRTCESVLAAGILHSNSIGNQGDDLRTYPIPYNIATPGNCPPPRLHPLQTTAGGLASSISCGATDDLDQLAGYSGRGPAAWESAPYTDYLYQNGSKMGLLKPDVCAPGPGTTSCNYAYSGGTGQPYVGFGGTSSATPHVGGCLALLAQACIKAGKPIVPAQAQEALENSAVRVGGQTKDKENHYGAGRVDVYAAFKYGNARGWW
jgi:subtilisin family serine protease